MLSTDGVNKMQRDEFMEMINKTGFSDNTKQLFVISYDMGFDAGRVFQMQKAIDMMDLYQAEKEIQ